MQRLFRLRQNVDFERVRAQGRQWRHPFVIVAIAPNGLAHNRYGFVASRRLGSAVIRNRARRRLREAVRGAAPRLKAGFDVVFIIRNEIVDQPYNRIVQMLDELFRRADLWRQNEDVSEQQP